MALRDTSWIFSGGNVQTGNAVVDRVEVNRVKKSVTQTVDSGTATTLTGYKNQTITYYRWIGLTYSAMSAFMTDSGKAPAQNRDLKSFTTEKTNDILNSWDVIMRETTLVKGTGWNYTLDTESVT